MATIPTQITWSTGQVVTAGQLNSNVRDATNAAIAPPLAVLRQTTPQTLSNTTWAALLWDTEDFDRDGGHSVLANTSRYTAQTAGRYMVGGTYAAAANATGLRQTEWCVNNSAVNGSLTSFPNAGAGHGMDAPAATMLIYLNVGDYLELFGWQSSGGNLATVTSSDEQPSMSVVLSSTS